MLVLLSPLITLSLTCFPSMSPLLVSSCLLFLCSLICFPLITPSHLPYPFLLVSSPQSPLPLPTHLSSTLPSSPLICSTIYAPSVPSSQSPLLDILLRCPISGLFFHLLSHLSPLSYSISPNFLSSRPWLVHAISFSISLNLHGTSLKIPILVKVSGTGRSDSPPHYNKDVT